MDELAHHRPDDLHLTLTALAQLLGPSFNLRVAPDGSDRRKVERMADAWCADFRQPRLASEGRAGLSQARHQTGEGRNRARTLILVEVDLSQKSRGGRLTNAGNRQQQVAICCELRMIVDLIFDEFFSAFDLTTTRFDKKQARFQRETLLKHLAKHLFFAEIFKAGVQVSL